MAQVRRLDTVKVCASACGQGTSWWKCSGILCFGLFCIQIVQSLVVNLVKSVIGVCGRVIALVR